MYKSKNCKWGGGGGLYPKFGYISFYILLLYFITRIVFTEGSIIDEEIPQLT